MSHIQYVTANVIGAYEVAVYVCLSKVYRTEDQSLITITISWSQFAAIK